MSDTPAGDVSAPAVRQGDLFEDLGPTAAPQQLLDTVTATLAQHYGVAYRYVWLNLGATRRFLIKPAQGGKSVSLAVASGDLIVMGGRAQRDWRHSVPKQATPAGPRISINFAPAAAGDPGRG